MEEGTDYVAKAFWGAGANFASTSLFFPRFAGMLAILRR